jgi:cytochrome c-type biogenesis protein CcmH
MRALFVMILLLCAPSFARADANSEALDKQSYEMYQQVFSPFCPGRSLNDCPSSKAHELKLEMRQKLEQGVPTDQILQAVFSRFGDKYRAVPLFEGIGTMVWLAPIGFVVVGLTLAVAVVLRRKKASSRTSGPQEARVSPELQRAIDEELSKLD